MSKLAILGGDPLIKNDSNSKHFVWPVIDKAIEQDVVFQLNKSISIYDRSGVIEQLEKEFENYLNTQHALLTSSGTSALHSMFVAANLQEDDEVICPAYTFFATVTPLFQVGAIPVLIDAREDGNIDPESVEMAITSRTKAIIVTHLWGMPCDMHALEKLAAKYKLLLFEDASHAHGAKYENRKVGGIGNAGALSIQGQKTITGGEGGVFVTNDDELYYRALLFGHYNKRCKKEIPTDHPLYGYATTGMGLKQRIHPIAASIALNHLYAIDRIVEGRNNIANNIINRLKNLLGIKMPVIPENITHSWYALPIRYIPEELGGLPISIFLKALQAEGCIEVDKPGSTAPLNYHLLFQRPEYLFPRYKGKLNYSPGDFPVAENCYQNTIKIPVWNRDIDKPIASQYIMAFEKVLENYKDLFGLINKV